MGFVGEDFTGGGIRRAKTIAFEGDKASDLGLDFA